MDDVLDIRWERRSVVDLTFLYQENIFDDGANSSYVKTIEYDAAIQNIPGFTFCDVSQVDQNGNGPQNSLGYQDLNNPGNGGILTSDDLSFTGTVTNWD